jgi:putative sterol carrier protein
MISPIRVLELDSESWAALYLGSTDLHTAVAAGKIKVAKGGQGELAGVFDLFDKLVSTRN